MTAREGDNSFDLVNIPLMSAHCLNGGFTDRLYFTISFLAIKSRNMDGPKQFVLYATGTAICPDQKIQDGHKRHYPILH